MPYERLHHKIRYNYIEDVKTCVDSRIDVNKIFNNYTPLALAIEHDCIEIVKFLIARGASTNAVGTLHDKETPLILCVKGNNVELAKYLIDMNANTCKPNKYGATPLSFAVSKGNMNMINLLMNNGAKFTVNDSLSSNGKTPLMQCIKKDNLELVKYLIDMNANTCKSDKDGATPLSLAVSRGNLKIANLLLNNGARFTVNNALTNGKTPLMQCIEKDNLELAKCLIDANANTCKSDNDGVTPLILAVFRGNIEMVNLLLDNGARSTINDALFEAVRVGNDGMTKLLLQNCTDINVKDPNGDTLFFKSVRTEKFSTVKLLIQQGANINQKDQNGQTALSIALSNLDFRTFQLLIESGADPNLAIEEIQEMAQKNESFEAYVKYLKLENLNPEFMGTSSSANTDALATDAQNNRGFTDQDEAPMRL